MKPDILIILIILAAIIIYNIRNKQKNRISKEVKYYPYKQKYLLTKTEYKFYKILKEKCDSKNILIFPKVRLEDFIDITSKQNKQKYRNYIKSRHIDFLLCNKNLNIIAAIELDDNSHNTQKAIKIDEFKNKLFQKIGIPLNRIKVASDYEYQINNIIIAEEQHL